MADAETDRCTCYRGSSRWDRACPVHGERVTTGSEPRRLWTVDLNAVSVIDADGKELAVDHSEGELRGPLVVHLAQRDDEQTERRVCSRDGLADDFRDWLHETGRGDCNRNADTCPDWPLAYQLADIALEHFKPSAPGGDTGEPSA